MTATIPQPSSSVRTPSGLVGQVIDNITRMATCSRELTDIGEATSPGWGVIDTACGFNVMGLDTFREWEQHFQEKHDIKIKSIPYHQKYKFGKGSSAVAARAALVPSALQGHCGVLLVCLVPGPAPLLLSKFFLTELRSVLDSSRHMLSIPPLGIQAQLAEASGEHFMLNLCEFPPEGWQEPREWRIKSEEVSVCLAGCSQPKRKSTDTRKVGGCSGGEASRSGGGSQKNKQKSTDTGKVGGCSGGEVSRSGGSSGKPRYQMRDVIRNLVLSGRPWGRPTQKELQKKPP